MKSTMKKYLNKLEGQSTGRLKPEIEFSFLLKWNCWSPDYLTLNPL